MWRFLKKLKIELPCDPAISLLGVEAKEIKSQSQRIICTPMFIIALFIIALFIIAKIWKQPKHPLMNEWIKKMWYIHTIEYYSVFKKEGSAPT